MNKLGWDFLAQYDELILCNDSCFGPLFDLAPIFERAQAADFWALTKGFDSVSGTWHLHSYFMAFKKPVFLSDTFKTFIASVKEEADYMDIIHNYEFPLTGLLAAQGFKPKVTFDFGDNIGHFWRKYIAVGYPFIKIKIFTKFGFEMNTDSLAGWQQFIKNHSSYNVKLIEQHLASLGVDYNYAFAPQTIKRFFRKIRRWFFYKNKKHGFNVLRICGIYLSNKNLDTNTSSYEDNSITLL